MISNFESTKFMNIYTTIQTYCEQIHAELIHTTPDSALSFLILCIMLSKKRD